MTLFRGIRTQITHRLRPKPLGLVLAALLLGFAHCHAQGECSQPPPCAAAPIDLGTLGGDGTRAFGISGDGTVVVGMSE